MCMCEIINVIMRIHVNVYEPVSVGGRGGGTAYHGLERISEKQSERERNRERNRERERRRGGGGRGSVCV